jgi:threonine dehydratase
MDLVGVDRIEAARTLLTGVVRETPMERSRVLAESHGGPVFLKCENLQRTGSFKIRGAYTRIHGLSDAERAHGVVCASAGNHAQGVALAAGLLGTIATVYMPAQAALPKIAATKAYGAEVHLHSGDFAETLDEAMAFARHTGAVFIHPFDHPDIIAGQGTVGLEILAQAPEVATVVVPVGGGGLIAGIATAIKATHPDVRIIAVQAEGAAAFPPSLAAGAPVRLADTHTLADGIAVGEPGALTYAHVTKLVDEFVTVTEESLSSAVLLCLERAKLIVEPAGAAAVAALLQYPRRVPTPAVAVLSGGNLDSVLLGQIIQHGMTAAGRYLALRLRIPDRPGSLAALLAEVSRLGANVLDVGHSRISGVLALGEVEVDLNLETRGPDHRTAVATALKAAGYTLL